MPEMPASVKRNDALSKVIEGISKQIDPCLVAEIMAKQNALTPQIFATYLQQAMDKAWLEFAKDLQPFNLTRDKFRILMLERIGWVMSETAKFKGLRIIKPF